LCFFSNSSEKISFAAPHFGQLHVKDFKFLKLSKPGQCLGVVIVSSSLLVEVVWEKTAKKIKCQMLHIVKLKQNQI